MWVSIGKRLAAELAQRGINVSASSRSYYNPETGDVLSRRQYMQQIAKESPESKRERKREEIRAWNMLPDRVKKHTPRPRGGENKRYKQAIDMYQRKLKNQGIEKSIGDIRKSDDFKDTLSRLRKYGRMRANKQDGWEEGLGQALFELGRVSDPYVYM